VYRQGVIIHEAADRKDRGERMAEPRGSGTDRDAGKKGISKTAIALGAAGLFLFIVGVKRKHRLDAEREIGDERAPQRAEE
jgi:hypothetical protein